MINNGFKTKQVSSLKTVGEILKESRERRNFSLEYVVHRIQIRKDYIENLEEGNYDKLPADVYIRGFLSKYAKFLDIDIDELLRIYKKERNIEKSFKKANGKVKMRSKKSPVVFVTPQMIKAGAIIVVILALISYLWYQLSSFTKAPTLVVDEPKNDLTINTNSVRIVGRTDKEAEIRINGQPVFVDPNGNFQESVGLQDGLNEVNIVASNRLSKETKITRRVMAELVRTKEIASEEKNNSSGNPQNSQSKQEKIELVIKIDNNPTWIYVETDGKLKYQGTMLPGSSQTFEADEKITLTTGDASSTEVIFNGKDLGRLGGQGEVIRGMEFTRELKTE